MIRRIALLGAIAVVSTALATPSGEPAWWIVAVLKGERVAIQPLSGETRLLPEPEMSGVVSPDGTRVAFISSDPKSPRESDLFVGEIDLQQRNAKLNSRMLTTGPEHQRPGSPVWSPNSRGVVFLAGDPQNQQAWYVDVVDEPAKPVRLSDGVHRTSNLCVSATGSIAYVAMISQQNKQRFDDLIVIDRNARSSDFSTAKRTTLVSGEDITAMAFSPDGTKLAYAGINTLRVHDFASEKASEVYFDAITPKLVNHMAWDLAWRPDGKVIALMLSFAGGIAGDGDKGPPKMYAEDKVFLVPADWSAPARTYGHGEKFPSPFAENEADESASPMPADESKPGWVRVPRERIQRIEWIPAVDVPVPPIELHSSELFNKN